MFIDPKDPKFEEISGWDTWTAAAKEDFPLPPTPGQKLELLEEKEKKKADESPVPKRGGITSDELGRIRAEDEKK